MVQAMNTGHEGSMCTGHANSGEDILSRLENMILMGMDIPLTAIRQQLASAINIIIHLGRLRDKSRKVLEIVELVSYEDGEYRMNPLYMYEEDVGGADKTEACRGKVQGKLRKTGELIHDRKLKAAGLSL